MKGAFCFLAFVCLANIGLAQTSAPTPALAESNRLPNFWRVILPAGIYQVRLDRINSISTHEYTIEPILRVTELTIETGGPVVTRFYFQETITPQSPMGLGQSGIDLVKSKTEEIAERLAGDQAPWRRVSKVYPATTHAHTVEYRLSSKEALESLRKSAEKAWTTGNGEEIKTE